MEVRGSVEVRAVDKNIAALASEGLYRTDHHVAIGLGQAKAGRDLQEVVTAHVLRLEALRRAGIVERGAEGLWKVPGDLAEPGRQCDAQRLGGVAVEHSSHLPIERQARVIGATWLDQQLIGGGEGLGDSCFGGEVKSALQQRADFLAEQGLAERQGQRVILAPEPVGHAAQSGTGASRQGHCCRHRTGASTHRRRSARGRHLPAFHHARQRSLCDARWRHGIQPSAVAGSHRTTAEAADRCDYAWRRGAVGTCTRTRASHPIRHGRDQKNAFVRSWADVRHAVSKGLPLGGMPAVLSDLCGCRC